jgi:NTE family protein
MADVDLVLEGGGMKGVGLAAAAGELLRAGYRVARVAGTSAGAIVGALLAAGVDEPGLAAAMARLDYARVSDRGFPKLPFVSEGLSLLLHSGAYEGDYVRDYVADELERLGVVTFADLRRDDPGADRNLGPFQRYGLVVMATDVTFGRLLRLPWDYGLLGLDPDEQLVADAVRASTAIPLYFEPAVVRDPASGDETILVDGGVLSNYPIEIFDRTDARPPRWPTLGIKVLPGLPAGDPQLFGDLVLPPLPPVKLLERVVATAIVGHDQTYLQRPCVRRRTVQVDTSAVGLVEFGASREQRETVAANGVAAVDAFLATWDWERFKADCPEAPADP